MCGICGVVSLGSNPVDPDPVGHMLAALQETAESRETPAIVVEAVRDYFVRSADFLRNTDDG